MNNVIKFGFPQFQQWDGIFLLTKLWHFFIQFIQTFNLQRNLPRFDRADSFNNFNNNRNISFVKNRYDHSFLNFLLISNAKNHVHGSSGTLCILYEVILFGQPGEHHKDFEEIITQRSLEVIFNTLSEKCIQLLNSDEVIDLLMEKCLLNKRLFTTLEVFKNVPMHETKNYVNDYYKVNMNYQNENFNKVESVVCPTVISSIGIIVNQKNVKRYIYKAFETVERSEAKCLASGDIEKDIKIIEIQMDEKRNSQISRIIKAENWIQNIKKIQRHDKAYIMGSRGNEDITVKILNTQKKGKRNHEIIKRQRFVVKRFSDRKDDFTTINSSDILKLEIKNIKKRFNNLKPNDEKNEKIVSKESLKMYLNQKNNKILKPSKKNELSLIREDIIKLADDIRRHFSKNSKTILSPTESVFSKFSNIKENDLKEINNILKETESNFQVEKKYKKYRSLLHRIDQFRLNGKTKITIRNGIKTNTNENYKISYTLDQKMTTLLDDPDTSNIEPNLNTNTCNKSVVSLNADHLNYLDLRDIHQISDEIHILAQTGILKA